MHLPLSLRAFDYYLQNGYIDLSKLAVCMGPANALIEMALWVCLADQKIEEFHT
jgi:hypothetical protein